MRHAVIFAVLLVAVHSSPTALTILAHKAKKVVKNLPQPIIAVGGGLGKNVGIGGGAGGLKGLLTGDVYHPEEHIKTVQVIHDKPVYNTVVKEVPVTVIKEEPFERIVHVDRPFEVIKEVKVERLVHVDRPVEVIKEVPFDVVSHPHFRPREISN